jgi:hypothetical protein
MCSPPYSCNPNIFTTQLNLGIIQPIYSHVTGLELKTGRTNDILIQAPQTNAILIQALNTLPQLDFWILQCKQKSFLD